MVRFILKVVAILVLAFNYTATWAWGDRAHAAIARIAQLHLSQDARTAVSEILEGKQMEIYASWFDTYRSVMLIEYVNDDGQTVSGTINHNMKASDSLVIIRQKSREALDFVCQYTEVLAKGREVSDSLRLNALLGLIHLVGDIHCPSHVEFMDRRNGRLAIFPVICIDQNVTLHKVWDTVLFDVVCPGGVEELTLAVLKGLNEGDIGKIQFGNPYEWGQQVVNESADLWNIQENGVVSIEYLHQHRDLAYSLVLKAGLRLAGLLNRLFVS